MPRVARRPRESTTAVNPANRHAEQQPVVTPELRQHILSGLHARKAGRVRQRKGHGPPKQPGHVKRPPNSFIVFRSEICDEEDSGGPQQALSRHAAALWHTLPMDDPIRILCGEIAAAEARKHREENPDYKYIPRKHPSRSVAAPKPKARGRKKAAAAGDEDEYVEGDEQHAITGRPTLRARSSRRVFVENDADADELANEEEEYLVALCETGSVSSITAVESDSDSDRETTVTAPASPSPAASSSSPSTPATAVLTDDSDGIVEFKTESSLSFGAEGPSFSVALEGSSTPRPKRAIKDEPAEPALSPLRPGCSLDPSLLAFESPAHSYWPREPDSPAPDVYGSTVKLEDDLSALSFLSQADPASTYESELASAGASGPWDLTRDLEDLKPLRFASDERSDTQMEIDPDILSGACMPMDVDMQHYLAWGLS